MNETNGQQEFIKPEEDHSSELFTYELIKEGIPEDVASQVDQLVQNRVLVTDDINDKVQAELRDLSTELMTQISAELSSSDVSHLKNKSAYLIGLIKTHKKKSGAAANNSNSAQYPAEVQQQQVKQDPVINENSIKITYSKYYPSKDLGPCNADKVKALLARTGYALDMSPGQRLYGPPPNWTGDKPRKGCEIFVGGLLRETFEDTLVPWLEECGKLYDLRIMTNPNDGVNKGFGFAIFCSPEDAKNAVNKLDGKPMMRGRVLKVNVHNPNTRLFIGGIDKTKTKEQIMQAIGLHTDGLLDIILKEDAEHPRNKHRGFAFADYTDHKLASGAMKRLLAPGTLVFNKNLHAEWAEPLNEVTDEQMAKVKVLYVTGLSHTASEEVLKDRFSPYGVVDSVKKIKNYAFVHFQQRDDALQAMNDLNGQKIDDCTVDVSLAKPPGSGANKKKEMPGGGGGRGGGGGGMMGGGGFGGRGGGMSRGGPRGGAGGGMRGGGMRGAPRGGARGGPRGGGMGGGGAAPTPLMGTRGGSRGAPRGGSGNGVGGGYRGRGAPAPQYGGGRGGDYYDDGYGASDPYAASDHYSDPYAAPASTGGGSFNSGSFNSSGYGADSYIDPLASDPYMQPRYEVAAPRGRGAPRGSGRGGALSSGNTYGGGASRGVSRGAPRGNPRGSAAMSYGGGRGAARGLGGAPRGGASSFAQKRPAPSQAMGGYSGYGDGGGIKRARGGFGGGLYSQQPSKPAEPNWYQDDTW